ncbi:AraC family transcriptional regulator [Vibrio anguillarum]|uniref:AraC family transcriptional regulator n=2 Tax=Vibrio anguillarum TaxID=55601 RepID=UPI00188CFD4C|nr:AraC family transcriptional regulator [Vibrio anguillarum]MBF4252991.1 AraC family transcriptional regulator [Vibrio anguillarum]
MAATYADTPKKLRKVALTQKIADCEKQLIVTPSLANHPLAEGQFLSYQAHHFTLHGGTIDELVTSEVVSTAPSSIIITILLEGHLSFGYDDLQFELSSPTAIIVNLTQPVSFHRHLEQGNHVAKLNIMLQPDWLLARAEKPCAMAQFLGSHKAHSRLTLNDELLGFARALIQSSTPQTITESLQLETTTMALIGKALTQITETVSQTPTMQKNRYRCDAIDHAIHHIETHLNQEIVLDELAQKMAMSVSNLQKKFKDQLGMTVSSYVRRRRLDIARQHLERGFVSITEAAYEAGYHHPSNFTAAFKKTFGISPQAFVNAQHAE